MNWNRKLLLVLAGLLVSCFSFHAQNKRLISGIIIDVANKEPLPYVTISLKKTLIGVVTNEEGKFDLYVPQDVIDTLFVNYLGYKHVLLDITQVKTPVTISMESTIVQLEEIVVRPLKPEDYILMAMKKIGDNYPVQPFETRAYYREQMIENKVIMSNDEGIFRTYCQGFLDTVKTQNQLLLYRTENHSDQMVFMNRMRKRRKERDSIDRASGKKPATDTSSSSINISSSFGGPGDILKSGSIGRKPENFLDSVHFKSYKYAFAKSSTYDLQELMVIDFESNERLDHVKEKGKIYINMNTHAIVRMEWNGNFYMPGIAKTIFFLVGIRVRNMRFEKKLEYLEVNGRWYPKNIQHITLFRLVDTHMFRKNDRSDFEIERFFTVNDLKTVNPSSVPEEKRFKSDKKMEGQIFNDENLTWEGLNIIKPETVKN